MTHSYMKEYAHKKKLINICDNLYIKTSRLYKKFCLLKKFFDNQRKRVS